MNLPIVGGRKVIFSTTIFIWDNEVATFNLDIRGIAFRISLKFIPDPAKQYKVEWKPTGNALDVTGIGWGPHNPGLASMPKIADFMTLDGEKYGFYFTHATLGADFQSVTFQVYQGGNFRS